MALAMKKNEKYFKRTLLYLGYVLIAFIFIFPMWYMLISSIKPDAQIVRDMSTLRAFIPSANIAYENYVEIVKKVKFFRFFKNSAVVAVLSITGATIINAMIGYALGLLTFKGKKYIVSLMLALAIVPTEAVIINRFLVVYQLGFLNSYAGLALPLIAYPMYIFLYYKHFLGMPKELMEAANVDGLNYSGIFWQIMLPLSKPICTTVAIMAFIRSWGDLLWPALVTRDDKFRTLPLALRALSTDVYVYWGQIFAFTSLMTLPVLIVFLLFQKQFIQSLAMSGIKG